MLGSARHLAVADFSAVFFRKTMPAITNPGALWDESMKFYPLVGAEPIEGKHEWYWPSGAKVKFAHLDGMKDALLWHGSQVPLFIFDELTEFEEQVFWYMLSRNRSTCGVRPYIMATCNPDADSWVAKLIEWWIDQNEKREDGSPNPGFGLPIPERAGKIRYFARVVDEIIWGDSLEEVATYPEVRTAIIKAAAAAERTFEDQAPFIVKSLTFVPGKLEENKILEKNDPSYRGNLMAQSAVDQARLLDGNWKARVKPGDYFPKNDITVIDELPTDIIRIVRRWDLASSTPNPENKDPDWTYGVKMGKRENGRFVIMHAIGIRKGPGDVDDLIVRVAASDGPTVQIVLPQDPGQAGVYQVNDLVKKLAGFPVKHEKETGPKEVRAKPLSSQWTHHNVDMLRGAWNAHYLSQMEPFPNPKVHDDAPDASSGAFNELNSGRPILEVKW